MTINILSEKLLSNNWGKLTQYSYEYTMPDGQTHVHNREVYDRGDGAVILLYNAEKKSIILTRQFRLPVWCNKHPTGMFIEACAGKVETNEDPLECIIREAQEETGHRVRSPKKVFSSFMSPGSVTELIHFYVASVIDQDKVSSGGGQHEEEEAIEVLEVPFEEAFKMIYDGRIQDGKTIILIQYLALQGSFFPHK